MVIAIIAVLASLLLPALANAKDRAKRVKCISNVKQQGLAFIMYADDYDGWYPTPDAPNGGLQVLYAISLNHATSLARYGLAFGNTGQDQPSVWECPTGENPRHPRFYDPAAGVPTCLIDHYMVLTGLNPAFFSGKSFAKRNNDPVISPLTADMTSVRNASTRPGIPDLLSNHQRNKLTGAPDGHIQSFMDGRAEWFPAKSFPSAGNLPRPIYASGWTCDYTWVEP